MEKDLFILALYSFHVFHLFHSCVYSVIVGSLIEFSSKAHFSQCQRPLSEIYQSIVLPLALHILE